MGVGQALQKRSQLRSLLGCPLGVRGRWMQRTLLRSRDLSKARSGHFFALALRQALCVLLVGPLLPASSWRDGNEQKELE